MSAYNEDRIRHADIRAEYGSQELFLAPLDNRAARLKKARSPKSNLFKFRSKICKRCNSSTTQRPDYAYSKFTHSAKRLIDSGADLVIELYHWEDDRKAERLIRELKKSSSIK